MAPTASTPRIPRPPCRRLRAFAFDPILSRHIDTSEVNEVIIQLPWDENLELGPVDDYLEVIDYDPASQAFYAPVNLNDPHLLAQDGLSPSTGNPLFHQQMAYAVARTTIRHFELALGRRALWSPRLMNDGSGWKSEFVRRLRVYPHAMREANAYYSPDKKALLFGYFPASATDAGENLPGETVFACLSHDIVAHETTHALLDGLHRRFIEPSNLDMWALHEALADVVALFQHFTYPDVLRHQIARTRGELESQNLLGQLAYQFGQAIGQYGALRSAIGSVDRETRQWIPEKPDPQKILHITEPHERGAILVAALFEAFLTVYKRRIADLLRIASSGTGILPPGELHPDLTNRLAREAAKTAQHMLHISIRALDYCPPVDVDFGDYLRAMITADADLVPDDRLNYRLAIVESFRRRGIYPRDVRNLSEESLLWHAPDEGEQKAFQKVFRDSRSLQQLVPEWELTTDRQAIFDNARESQGRLHEWFRSRNALDAAKAASLALARSVPRSIYRDKQGTPKFEVHSVRPARRIGPDGQTVTDLVIEITQRRHGYYSPDDQRRADRGKISLDGSDFVFRGGCTLLVDPDTAQVRYCIYKNILSENRLDRMRQYLAGGANPSLRVTYFGDPLQVYSQRVAGLQREPTSQRTVEPFSLLHRSLEQEEAF